MVYVSNKSTTPSSDNLKLHILLNSHMSIKNNSFYLNVDNTFSKTILENQNRTGKNMIFKTIKKTTVDRNNTYYLILIHLNYVCII